MFVCLPVGSLLIEGTLPKSSIRVLVVDDFEQWRRFHKEMLQKRSQFQVIVEVSDGLAAVNQAQQLQPDLILLDIGLPTLNGIEAARRIREVSPVSKVLFVSENRSPDVVAEAMSTGAGGYVVKSDAAHELLPAVSAVLQGKRFVSASLAGGPNVPANQHGTHRPHSDRVVASTQPQNVANRKHEVGFYSENRHLLDHVTHFIAAALNAGTSAIVIATESHRESLLLELHRDVLNMSAAIEEGRYIALDAGDAVSMFMVNGMLDKGRFLERLGDLIVTATEVAKGENPRVSIFGECVHLLCAQGNVEAAIQMERLGNKLIKIHAVDILCGYSPGLLEGGMDSQIFERICAEHSTVHSI